DGGRELAVNFFCSPRKFSPPGRSFPLLCLSRMFAATFIPRVPSKHNDYSGRKAGRRLLPAAIMPKITRRAFGLGSLALAVSASRLLAAPQPAQPKKRLLIPGTGFRIAKTGDDFEDEKFLYYSQHPKSRWETDKEMRIPGGLSANNQWPEGR